MTSTNVEPHWSSSSLVAAQTSAWLSWIPEFPWAQQSVAAAALIAGELAACFCPALPSSLLPPYPVPSMCYLFSWILPLLGAAWQWAPLHCPWSPGSLVHSSPPAGGCPCQQLQPLLQNQSWMVQKEGSDSILDYKCP